MLFKAQRMVGLRDILWMLHMQEKNQKRGTFIVFEGIDGAGKTTLLKMIMGEVEPDEGNINIGQTVKIGYYTQEIVQDKSAGRAVS